MLRTSLIITLTGISLALPGTFLLLPSPASYTIYNEYEQSLSEAEASRFVPYTPLLLLDWDVLLSDRISHAARFRFGKETFFLLKNAWGRFAGEDRKDSPLVINNCASIGDTVEVTKGGILIVTPVSGPSRTIAQGRKLVRLFGCNGRYYVLSLDAPSRYGWSSLEPASTWRRIGMFPVSAMEARSVTAVMPDNLRERILGKVAAANESYRRFFSHFDSLTGNGKNLPQWRCECTASQCRCILSPHSDESEDLSESTRELCREIENLLSGSGFILTGGPWEIMVTRERP